MSALDGHATLLCMPVHPQVLDFLALLRSANLPPFEQSTPAEARMRLSAAQALEAPPEPIATRDLELPGPGGPLPVRVYTPAASESGPRPGFLYFHGGGWVIGSIETHDRICRALANLSGCILVSVDYRLAPEHKFPAAVEDCEAATRYVSEHAASFGIDPQRLGVGGDSAGGNLAAVVALRSKAAGQPAIKAQVLIYPATGHGLNTASRKDLGEGYFLTKGTIRWFSEQYLRSAADEQHPHAAPMYATDLRGLPKALVVTAEYDPLIDEGEAYAARLREAGVPTTLRRYDGMIHGFFQFTGIIPAARIGIDETAQWLRENL